MIDLADEELAQAPADLPRIGPPQAMADAAGLGDRERALLALATRPPPATTRAEHEQQAPWSVRGVSQVARIKAAEVAAHRRVTIGEWVNHAILTYADREAGIATRRSPSPAATVSEEETEKAMRLVAALARHIDQTGSATAEPRDLSDETRPPTPAPVLMPISPVAPAVAPGSPIATLVAPAPEIAAPVTPVAVPAAPVAASAAGDQRDAPPDPVEAGGHANERRPADVTSAVAMFADRLKLTCRAAQPAAPPAPRLLRSQELPLQASPPQASPPQASPPQAPTRQAAPSAVSPGAPPAAEDRMSETELAFWQSIKDSDSAGDYEAYLETYPDGVFAPIARRRTTRDEPAAATAAPPSQPGNGASRRRPVASYPKFDYDRLNERAIENTRRLNPDKG